MINSIETYADAGRKAGEASKQQDWPRAQSWLDWQRKALRLETAQDRKLARTAFETAYRQAATRGMYVHSALMPD